MSYGLKGKVRQIIAAMDVIRATKRECTLNQYIAENFKDNDGKPLSVGHLYSELGIEERRTTVQQLFEKDDNAKYLMAEIIRDGVRRGIGMAQREQLKRMRQASMAGTFDNGRERFMSREVFLDPVMRGAVQATFYPDLVIREETVAQPTVTIPKIDLSEAALKDSAEAATIEEGSVTYGSKIVTLKKKARGFKVTYEAIQFNSLSLAQIWFEDAGRILGHTLNGMAVDGIINGDQTDTSESADVIGVDNTSNGITWKDLARVAIRFAILGRFGIQAIGNEDSCLNYVTLAEMKQKYAGSAILQTMMKSPLTFPEDLYASTKVTGSGANAKLVIQDPSASMIQLTAQPLLVETDKIIAKQIEQAVVSIYTGFAKVQRNASVIIDPSVAFSSNGWATWMNPYSE